MDMNMDLNFLHQYDSMNDPSERIDEERAIDEFWDEVDRLWRQDEEMMRNERFDDPYASGNINSNSTLDAVRANVSNAMRQPSEIDSSRLATDFVKEHCKLPSSNACDLCFDIQQTARGGEFQSFKRQLQQGLIKTKHSNDLTAIQQTNSEKLFEGAVPFEIEHRSTLAASTPKQSKNGKSYTVSVTKPSQSHAQQLDNTRSTVHCNRGSIVTRSCHKAALDGLDAREDCHSESVAVYTKDNSTQLEGPLDENRMRSNRKRKSDQKHNMKSSDLSQRKASSIKKVKINLCKVCNQRFSNKSNLATHLRIHTGEKPYKCRICDSSFNRNDILAAHLRIHTGEKPFECDICNKSFRQKSTLSNHINIHSGRKPYECKVCKKTFRQLSTLHKHLQRRHV